MPIKEDGRTIYLLTTAVDYTQRKCAEDALRESEARLRHAIEATGMGTWSSDRAGGNITWDASLCRIYGIAPADAPRDYQAIIGHVHPEDREHFRASMRAFEASGRFEDLEFRIIRGDGAVRHLLSKGSVSLDSSGRAVGSIGGVFDVTDQKRLEEQLLQVQKMDAIGQLTAGIAHNFNNILGVILPNVELCRLGAPSYLASRLDDIAHAAERGAEMVRQLMIFARRETSARKQPIDVSESVRRTAEICRTTFDRRITVDISIASGLPYALANAGQMEQILLNICLNARDAFEEGQTAEPRIELSADYAASGTIRIRVSDNGPGMDEATRSRIFEPFFTT
ncbi:MAG: PAS domain-containing protein, partial [Polyangiaceae bacterium]|nr:PAS domain-containing protein [Polyangiaceae bacterium]